MWSGGRWGLFPLQYWKEYLVNQNNRAWLPLWRCWCRYCTMTPSARFPPSFWSLFQPKRRSQNSPNFSVCSLDSCRFCLPRASLIGNASQHPGRSLAKAGRPPSGSADNHHLRAHLQASNARNAQDTNCTRLGRSSSPAGYLQRNQNGQTVIRFSNHSRQRYGVAFFKPAPCGQGHTNVES